jgi:hypothetical protein
MNENRIATIISKIKLTFGSILYPGDEYIVVQSTDLVDEREYLLKSFVGNHWQTLSYETLMANRNNVPWFTPHGFRFYLPAFMIEAILHGETSELLLFSVIYRLIPNDDGIESNWLKELENILRPEEKQLIRDYLKLYVELHIPHWYADPNDEYTIAIRYWDRH